MTTRLIALAISLGLLCTAQLRASDLGTAGPIRSFGGGHCFGAAADSCLPPPVDTALVPAEQVRAHIARALVLLDNIKITAAKADLGEALRIDPDNIEALTLRGRLEMSGGNPMMAKADIGRALALAPNDADLLASKAAIASAFGDTSEGLDLLAKAIAIKPDDLDILFIRAQTYLQRHDQARAFVDLSAILALEPDNARARALRSIIQLDRKTYDLAILDADGVLAVQPGNTEALIVRAKAWAGLGKPERAMDDYTLLLDHIGGAHALYIPDNREAMLARARLYLQFGRKDEAARDLAAVIDQGGQAAILRLQVFLHGNGFPNVEIDGKRSPVFDTAVAACFSDQVCGPNLHP